jgi:hypothetical protein
VGTTTGGSEESTPLTITFDIPFETTPVVIMGVPSYEGSDEVVVSVTDVTTTSFRWIVHEPSCIDGTHAVETISWLAATEGKHTYGGTTFVVGKKLQVQPEKWTTINFQLKGVDMGTDPMQLTTIQDSPTDSTTYYVNTRHQSSTDTSFQVMTQSDESNKVNVETHDIGYVVVQSGCSSAGYSDKTGCTFVPKDKTGGAVVRAGITPDTYTHDTKALGIGNGFSSADYAFFGGLYRTDGGDPVALRYVGAKQTTRVNVFLQEEKCANTEVTHTPEPLAYLAISANHD